MGDLDILFNVTEANKKKCHHDISTPTICITFILLLSYETQGQVIRSVTLTLFSRSQGLIAEKSCHHDISTPTYL